VYRHGRRLPVTYLGFASVDTQKTASHGQVKTGQGRLTSESVVRHLRVTVQGVSPTLGFRRLDVSRVTGHETADASSKSTL
jgi:hypothetical protein